LALLLRSRLRSGTGADTRVAIGIGSLEQVVEDRISMSTGEAVVLSGRSLDRLPGYFGLTGALPASVGAMADWLPMALHLCSELTRQWTRRQAELVSIGLLLEKPTRDQIAQAVRPKVTKQTVQESLGGAGWRSSNGLTGRACWVRDAPARTGQMPCHSEDRNFSIGRGGADG
jgi:hypothetical protein